jgi:hypothetical protein
MKHRWTFSILMAGALLVGTSCSTDREALGPTPAPEMSLSASPSVDTQIHRLIPQLFPGVLTRAAVFIAHEYIEWLYKKGKTALAQQKTLELVAFAFQRYANHQLIGDQSAATQAKLRSFVDLSFQLVGLGSAPIPPDALGPDGAVAIVGPTGGQVVTQSQLAGAQFPPGALPQNVIVTITRVTSEGNPLPTNLQQFPLFYEFKTFPEVAEFGELVTVGVCVLDAVVEDAEVPFGNLRVAHPLHSDPSAIEILPLADQGFIDQGSCDEAFGARQGFMNNLAGAGKSVAQDLFWVMMGAPKDLSATGSRRRLMPGGLGGRTGSFSTFGAVNFTGEFVPYQEQGYRYLIDATPPAGFQQPNFDASAWFSGSGAFGSGGAPCTFLESTIHTSWPAAGESPTEILLRKRFSGSAQNVQIHVPVDNDVQVFVNGVDITSTGGTVGEDGFLPHENCADPNSPFVFSVQNSSLLAGGNLVVVRARDRGSVSYVDVKVTGQLPEE